LEDAISWGFQYEKSGGEVLKCGATRCIGYAPITPRPITAVPTFRIITIINHTSVVSEMDYALKTIAVLARYPHLLSITFSP